MIRSHDYYNKISWDCIDSLESKKYTSSIYTLKTVSKKLIHKPVVLIKVTYLENITLSASNITNVNVYIGLVQISFKENIYRIHLL